MAGRIIGVANQKGGAGKTTTACAVADELYNRGFDVLLVDLDPQGSALVWADVAEELGVDGPTVISMTDGWHRKIQKFRENFDFIVLDPPAKNEEPQRRVLQVSDLVMIPTQAHTTDIWALGETVDTATTAIEFRPELVTKLLLTRVDTRTNIATRAAQLVEETGMAVFQTSLGDRVAYPYSLARGLGPTRHEPAGSAAKEIQSLVTEVLEELN